MKSTVVYPDGSVRCPKCGASVLGAASKRSVKGKVLGGAVLAPKRIKCSGCGEMLKRGNGVPVAGAGRSAPQC